MNQENEKLIQKEGEVVQIDHKENPTQEQSKRKNCLEVCEDLFINVIKSFYALIVTIMKFVLIVLGYILYPIKERFFTLANDIDLAMNPYKDPNYQEIQLNQLATQRLYL